MKLIKKYIWPASWVLASGLLILQIILSFHFHNKGGSTTIRYIGWGFWLLTCIFGWVPIFTLYRKGGVPKGESYSNTTVLVDSGIYGIVRHPQYLSFILLGFSLILIVQHWVITLIGFFAITFSYLIIIKADESCIEKFGDDYKQYMKRVPSINVIAGIWRILKSSLKR